MDELSSTTDLRSSELKSSITFLLSVLSPCMNETIVLAVYGACSGETDFGDTLRMVLISGMKVSPITSYIRKVANLPDGVFDSFAQHLLCSEQQCHSKSPKRGPTRLPLPENRLQLRIENMSFWCPPAPKIWVGIVSLVQVLPFVKRMRAVVSSFAIFSNELPGHDGFEINAERDAFSVVRTRRYRFHHFTLLYQSRMSVGF